MRKGFALLLVLVMCFVLTLPIMAEETELPETWDEATDTIDVGSTMSDYENFVAEECDLYEENGGYLGLPVTYDVSRSFSGYYVQAWDTEIKIINQSDRADSYLFFYVTAYVMEDGKWINRCGPGCSMRETGEIMTRVLDESDPPLMRIRAGETCTFTANEMKCGGRDAKNAELFVISVVRCYDGYSNGWRANWCYLVNDEKADAIIKAGVDGDPGNPFTDVAKDAYYHAPVLWALEKQITTGATKMTFNPTGTCTRGQVATFLWRAKGCPEPVSKTNPFTDVTEADYFYKAVLWAYENGITTGATATTFNPTGTCTSGQVITFLWRANGKPVAEHSDTAYYAEAVAWAAANQLLEGTDIPFAPDNLSPRADIVTYLYRDMVE